MLYEIFCSLTLNIYKGWKTEKIYQIFHLTFTFDYLNTTAHKLNFLELWDDMVLLKYALNNSIYIF